MISTLMDRGKKAVCIWCLIEVVKLNYQVYNNALMHIAHVTIIGLFYIILALSLMVLNRHIKKPRHY